MASPDPTSFDARAVDWDTPQRIARAQVAADTIRAAVRFAPGTRAIDIGAGTGLLGLALLDRLGELVLADTSDGMLEQARRKIRARGLEHVRAVRFDVVADPAPAGAPFDAVVSQLVLHHIADTAAALSGMLQLLVPGGQLVVLDLDTEDGSFHGSIGQDVHHQGFDRDEVANISRRLGYVDVRIDDGGRVGGAEHDDVSYPMFLLTARRG